MSRLPVPGSDNNTWGDVLNNYLSVSHEADGTLKPVPGAKLSDGTISENKLSPGVQTKLNQNSPVTSVAGKTGDVALVKADVGLGNTANTSDADKPVSTATQAALDDKLDKATLSAGSDGQVLLADSSQSSGVAWGMPINLQVFTSSGTWIKPTTGTIAKVICIGGGHGGGGGGKQNAGTTAGGGGGGSGTSTNEAYFRLADLPATVAVTVGAGGVGGAGSTVAGTAGSNGGWGGASLFGSFLTSNGGNIGSGGNTVGGNGGPGTNATVAWIGAGAGITGGAGAAVGVGTVMASGTTGGGGGGGVTNSGVTTAGGVGGRISTTMTTAPAGGTNGGGIGATPADAIAIGICGGAGGGGGGSSTTGNGGNGGNGARPGGGGGGGGAAQGSGNGGNGGNGGGGQVVVIVN